MIKDILDEIANEPGTNAKMDILRKYQDNELLKRVMYMACSKRVKFYIKQIKEVTPKGTNNDLAHALLCLEELSSRRKTGNNALLWLASVMQELDADNAYVIERIIDKDLKIGMGTTNINKIFPKLIEKTPYMGAKAYDKDLVMKIFENGGVGISQVKMDGRYNNAIIRGGEVENESRAGEPVFLNGARFIEELSHLNDCVLNGEFTMDGIDRYKSNGIIKSMIDIGSKLADGKDMTKDFAKFEKRYGFTYQEGLNRIRYTVWDIISIDEYFDKKSSVPYDERLERLSHAIDYDFFEKVSIVEWIHVFSFEDAMEHFTDALERGLEGTILKAKDGEWKDGKPKWQVKMKLEMDIDLKVIGFNYGTKGTKNENVISSLTAQSSDGKMICAPAGISEADMAWITENQDELMGKIVECKCNGLTKFDEKKGAFSVLSPVYKSFRDDKTEADSLDAIQKIEEMVKSLA